MPVYVASVRLFIGALVGGVLISAGQAATVTLPPKLAGLNFAQFCPAMNQPPSKSLLARAIIKSYQISPDFVDWSDKGEASQSDMRNAVTLHLCNIAKTPSQKDKCFPENGAYGALTADANNQSLAVNEFENVLRLSSAPSATEFDLVFKKGKLNFKRVKNATKLDAAQNTMPVDESGNATIGAQVFAEGNQFFDIACQPLDGDKKSSPGNRVPIVDIPTPGPLSPAQKKAQQTFFAHFRLRGDVSDLSIASDNDAFKGASSASFSASADNVGHKSTTAGKVSLGYAFDAFATGDWLFQTIPYVKYERNATNGTGAPRSGTDVSNLGYGVIESATVPMPLLPDAYADATLQADHTESLRSGARVGKLQFGYSPRPFFPVIGFPAQIGFLGLRSYLYTTGLINIGQVYSAGTDTSLSNGTFTQGGVRVSASLYGEDQSPFSGVSFPVTYTNLYGFSGPYKTVQNFSVGVNYAITKNFSIGVSHLSGRNVDTFEKVHSYQFKLGVKY